MDVEKRYGVVQMTLKHYEQDFADRHMLDECAGQVGLRKARRNRHHQRRHRRGSHLEALSNRSPPP